MPYEDDLREAARRYAGGLRAVEERRAAWDRVVREVLLPVLQQAVQVLRSEGVEASADRHDDRENASDVTLRLAPLPTGIVWQDRDGKEIQGVEHGAAMGYGQGDDGRVGHWRKPHWLDDDAPPRAHLDTVVDHPHELTRAVVEKHVTEFLREALETSFRGPAPQLDRPIGFSLPTTGDDPG